MLSVFFFVLLLPVHRQQSDDYRYDIAKIPAALRRDAEAVVRHRHVRFEVKDIRKALQTVTEAVTIFTREQSIHGEILLPYDKYQEIEDLEGAIYDANGKEVRELDDDDISDYSAISGYSIYEDNRVKHASLLAPQLPYTVEYRYEISYDGFLNWPTWFAQEDEHPVEETHFEVVLPKGESLRYWCNVDSAAPVIATDGSNTTYRWEATNLVGLPDQVADEGLHAFTTIVSIAPREFVIDGSRGDMGTWASFGRWFYSLWRDRDQLPQVVREEVRRILDTCSTRHQMIAGLYRHFQSKTRYVSVQLGIGSWQPYDAIYVHERGYGDCKALTNYMMALLKAAGIQSYPVLINPGHQQLPMIIDFPSNQFTHVILCVPLERDTVWLECTSQSFPPGHIGSNNENRFALLVGSNGGRVVRTPTSPSSENRQRRSGTVDIQQSGNARARVRMTFSGCQRDRVHGALESRSPEEQQRWLVNSFDLPHANLYRHEVGDLTARDSLFSFVVDLALPRFATATGNRLFFLPAAMERRTTIPPESRDRRSPIIFDYAFLDSDSLIYTVPPNYSIEALPSAFRTEASFGSFMSSTERSGDSCLIFKRRLEVHAPHVPSEQYNEYRTFFSNVAKADRAQVVLVRTSAR